MEPRILVIKLPWLFKVFVAPSPSLRQYAVYLHHFIFFYFYPRFQIFPGSVQTQVSDDTY